MLRIKLRALQLPCRCCITELYSHSHVSSFYIELETYYVVLAGLKLLSPSDPPTLASWVAGIAALDPMLGSPHLCLFWDRVSLCAWAHSRPPSHAGSTHPRLFCFITAQYSSSFCICLLRVCHTGPQASWDQEPCLLPALFLAARKIPEAENIIFEEICDFWLPFIILGI